MSLRPDLDVAFGYYFQSQNDFNTAACTGYGTHISSNKCSGGQQGIWCWSTGGRGSASTSMPA